VATAVACRRWLDGVTPNLDEARWRAIFEPQRVERRTAVDWIINKGNRVA
jgi:hypothetical protein